MEEGRRNGRSYYLSLLTGLPSQPTALGEVYATQ